jgi:predicted MFS family arabinose efflux permease
MMRRVPQLLVLLTALSTRASAQLLSVSGNPGALNVVGATPGSNPNSVSNASTTYTVTVIFRAKIAVSINSAMPSGLTLSVTLAAPPSAVSQGAIALSTTAQDAVNGIPLGTVLSTRGVTYALSATAAAGVVASTTRTVTLTLLPDP